MSFRRPSLVSRLCHVDPNFLKTPAPQYSREQHLKHGLWRPSQDPRVSNYEKKTIDKDKDIEMTLFSPREHIYFTPTFKDSGVTAEKGTERV